MTTQQPNLLGRRGGSRDYMKLPHHRVQTEKGSAMLFPDRLFRKSPGTDHSHDSQLSPGKNTLRKWYERNGTTSREQTSAIVTDTSSTNVLGKNKTSDIYSIIESIINDLPPAEEEHTKHTVTSDDDDDDDDSSSIYSGISTLMVFDDEDSCSTVATQQVTTTTGTGQRPKDHQERATSTNISSPPGIWQRVEL